ncbi:MAG: M81 family metallopeptidase [Betaproteobacteria bacterium]|nr:M81 family metallopeptidase [Betaproteobacteria bacterium]
MARIAIGGFMHETNSFVSTPTDYKTYCTQGSRPPLSRGKEILERLRNTSFATSGFLQAMQGKHELVPTVWGAALASGTVTREAFERICAELIGALSLALPVDGLYLDLHGAMVTDDFEDGEGELLRRVRAVVGENVPVVISLDWHANVTARMVRFSDGLVGYLTYPHIDQPETGQRAAKVMTKLLERGRPKGRAFRKTPFLIPLTSQCTDIDPSKAVVEKALSLEGGDVLNVSYLSGFPPSDLAECGPSVSVHAYSQELADKAADTLAQDIERREPEFAVRYYAPDEGVKKAMEIAAKASRPVILADTQDNPGAGGTADTTGVLAALVRNNAQSACVGVFCDPDAAAAAHKAGEGAQIELKLGGKFGPEGVEPFQGRFRVVKLGNGLVRTTGPHVGGRNLNLGPMALLQIGGVTVVLSSVRMQAHDQAPFRHVGIEPKDQKILALKSTVHFRADFGPLAEDILVVLAPGAHWTDPAKYPYKRLRAGVRLYPLGPKFLGVQASR